MDTIGHCLKVVLRERGYRVTVAVSFEMFLDDVFDRTRTKYDLVIATNTSLTPATLTTIIPDIKACHQHARIIVLSGYYPGEFIAHLTQEGIDGFLQLPFDEATLLDEVALQLSKPIL
jgi:DNA-binding NtrC family response regulator